MINIKVKMDDDFISKVTIKGHAGYSEVGTDIVCASVSSIAITTVNASLKIDSQAIAFDEKDGFLVIDVKKDNRVINILINNMIDLLKELEIDYPKNIKIIFN